MAATTAALYMWTKMYGLYYVERVNLHVPSAALTDRTSLHFERATNDTEEVFEIDALRDEHRLLISLRFELTTTTVVELMPFLTFTADRADEFRQALLLHVQISAAVPTSALVGIAWLCASTLVWQMAVVTGAFGAFWL